MSDWRDRMVGDRMAVDNEFSRQVANSRFSNQEWSLIMTATTFDIESPHDPEAARMIADTSDLPQMIPQLEEVAQVGPMGTRSEESESNPLGEFFGSIGDLLGIGGAGGDDDEKLAEAEELLAAYANLLHARLEETGKWDELREAAAEENA